jgi:hypothetical protein
MINQTPKDKKANLTKNDNYEKIDINSFILYYDFSFGQL